MARLNKGIVIAAMGILLALSGPATFAAKGGKGGGKPDDGDGGSSGGEVDIAVTAPQKKGGYNLSAMDAAGDSLESVASGAGDFTMRSCWSPDGTQLAFIGDTSGYGIYVVDADGSDLTKVASTTFGYTTNVSWSPAATADGKYRIVFDDDGGGSSYGNQDLFAVTPDGSSRVRLTSTTSHSESHAVWSPTANRLAFISTDHSDGGTDVRHAMVPLTSGTLVLGAVTLVTDTADCPLRDRPIYSIDWARDTDVLAIAAVPSNQSAADLWVLPLSNPAAAKNITNTSGTEERHPTWSPDDGTIAFWTPGGKPAVKTVSATGGSIQTLKTGVQSPAWKR